MTTDRFTIHNGNSLEVLATLPEHAVDAVVTDPPYELGFMGKGWDSSGIANNVDLWRQVMRVLKPGGHLLAFSGTRTYHRMACAIEDAGFEVRDQMAWCYGSGFPKSLNVTEAMEKWQAGERFEAKAAHIRPGVYDVTRFLRAARDKAGWTNKQIDDLFGTNGMSGHWTSVGQQPAVPSVRQWEILKERLGFGSEMDALVADLGSTERPEDWGAGANDSDKKFLDTLGRDPNATSGTVWGTALKPAWEPICVGRKPLIGTVAANILTHGAGALNIAGCKIENDEEGAEDDRWPSNIVIDGSDEVRRAFPLDGERSASRFFYCAKVSAGDREEGNNHPTVKPTELMRHLCRLITPPKGTVLDPFMGSGSTGKAAMLEGFNFVGIDLTPEYCAIARSRISNAASLEFATLGTGNTDRDGKQMTLFAEACA